MLIETIKDGAIEFYAATICERHSYREIARYAYQLENFDCPACVWELERDRQAREDRADMLARRGHPSICLCNTCAPHEEEYDRLNAEEAERLVLARLTSPTYCDGPKPVWTEPPF